MARHVLVVDDDKEIRTIVTYALNRHGFDVAAAQDGQQLRRMLVQRLPDLIILDIMMPGEDGYQLCTTLRNDPQTQHIPIVIITAHAENIYERISEDLGVAKHITKPFHPMELVETINRLLP